MLNKKNLLVGAGMLVPAMLLVACGGGDSGDEKAPDNSQDSGQSSSEAQAMNPKVLEILGDDIRGKLADALPEEFQDQSEFNVAVDATMGVPISYIEEGQTNIEGFTVDFAQALGYVLGKDVNIINTPFDSFIPGLQANRFDYAISIMLDTEERQKHVTFVDYLVDGSSILLSAESPLDSVTMDDLCGMSVGAISGGVEIDYLEEQNEKCDDPIDIQVFQANNEILLAVTSGRLDAMMGIASQMSYIESISEGKVKSVGDVIGEGLDGVAFPKDNGLAEAAQQALQLLIDEGMYLNILGIYGMESNQVEKATINDARL